MKAENTLQIMMDFYSDLFYTRQKCLDHLFCCIGNGYEWKNGELIETDADDERLQRYSLKKDIIHAEPSEFVKQLGLQQESIQKTLMEIKGRIDFTPNKWYPISKEYSYICNYPDDIKPDWLALINECKEMLIADNIEVPKNTPYKY